MSTTITLAATGLLAAVIATGVLTRADTYSSETCEATSSGTQGCHSESSTLIEENGRGVLVLLAVPIVITGAMLVAAIYRLPVNLEWLLASTLFAACLVAIFSIGFFFLPAADLLIAAAAAERREAVAT